MLPSISDYIKHKYFPRQRLYKQKCLSAVYKAHTTHKTTLIFKTQAAPFPNYLPIYSNMILPPILYLFYRTKANTFNTQCGHPAPGSSCNVYPPDHTQAASSLLPGVSNTAPGVASVFFTLSARGEGRTPPPTPSLLGSTTFASTLLFYNTVGRPERNSTPTQAALAAPQVVARRAATRRCCQQLLRSVFCTPADQRGTAIHPPQL